MAVGYYKLGQANKGRRAEQHEKRLARIALMPMLQVSGTRLYGGKGNVCHLVRARAERVSQACAEGWTRAFGRKHGAAVGCWSEIQFARFLLPFLNSYACGPITVVPNPEFASEFKLQSRRWCTTDTRNPAVLMCMNRFRTDTTLWVQHGEVVSRPAWTKLRPAAAKVFNQYAQSLRR